jgi:oleandomycin transport system ATP-binding protein
MLAQSTFDEGAAMTFAIQAEGLVKHFGETAALAGKTTAVRILATLLRPDGGHATVGGYDVVTEAHQVRQLIALTGPQPRPDDLDGLAEANPHLQRP